MNEKGSKRRDWVKNAAIVFLTVMLILTFFSNTIMNYSLPEVAVQYVESGTITSQVRGTGTVESDDPYEVTVKETRTVESISVREGDTVQKGDILFTLADKESDEIVAKQKELDAAMLEFERSILSGNISNNAVNNVQNGNISSVRAYQNKIIAADAKIADCEKKVNEAQTAVDQLETQKGILENSTPDTSQEQAKVNEIQAALNNDPVKQAKDKFDSYVSERAPYLDTIEEYNKRIVASVSGGDVEYTVSEEDYRTACLNRDRYNELIEGQNQIISDPNKKEIYDKLVKDLNEANAALASKQNSVENSKNNVASQKRDWEAELTARTNELKEANAEREQLIEDIAQELALSDQLKSINEMRVELEELRAQSFGATVTAPISGTISVVGITSGKETNPNEAAMKILPEGVGYTMQFSVTTEQARTLSPGIEASLVNAWRYDDVVVTLKSIRPDPQNPSQNKLLVFDVTGSVTDGQSLSVSVGDRSSNYDMIVPNSAIREDSNGTFVLQVESRPSPLSTRYIATRVDVEVVAKDDTKSAITGGLYSYGSYVITTSDNPVVAGQQVRLADN